AAAQIAPREQRCRRCLGGGYLPRPPHGRSVEGLKGMIALLKGRIEAYEDDGVILDVGGVGYHVTCSTRTLAALPRVGEVGKLFTEMLVSENAIRLVGFASEAERAWFRLLDNVQGVGTRVALAVLSTLSTGELASAIAFGDKAMIGRSP